MATCCVNLNDEQLEIAGILQLRPPQFIILKQIFLMLKDMEALSLNIQGSEISIKDVDG